MANVQMERALYERRQDDGNLSEFVGFLKTPAPGVVNEEWMIREFISASDRKRLILDYSDHRLMTIGEYLGMFHIGYCKNAS